MQRLGLSELAKKGLKVDPAFVRLVNELTSAREASQIKKGRSVVSPRLKKLIFKQFDRFGVGVSAKIAKRHGLSTKMLENYRKEWIASNPNKPRLYRRDTGRSVQSFVRIMWKLQHYNFHGAIKRIVLEERLAGELISYKHILQYYKGNKHYLRLAMETDYWKELEKKSEIPDLHKRVPFEKGFKKMLRAEGIGLKKNPLKAKELKERVRRVVAGLDRTTRSLDRIARSTDEKRSFVELVNTAFNIRCPKNINK